VSVNRTQVFGDLDGSFQAQGAETRTLAMVALYPRAEEAEALAVEGGLEVDDLHVTLVFLGDADEVNEKQVTAAVSVVAQEFETLGGNVGGIGRFSETEDGVPILAFPDVRGLTHLRERVADELGRRGIQSPSEHGFLPHMTLIYADPGSPLDLELAEETLGRLLTFDAISVVVGDNRTDYPLGGAMNAATTVSVTIGESEEQPEAPPQPWKSILAVEGYPTDDNTPAPRYMLPDSLGWRDLPLPFMVQAVTAEGHDGAVVSGRIDTIERVRVSDFLYDPDFADVLADVPAHAVVIFGRGIFAASEEGADGADLVDQKMLRGVSVDLVATEWAFIDRDSLEVIPDEDIDLDALLDGRYYHALKSGQIGGATATPIQAFGPATIALAAAAELAGWNRIYPTFVLEEALVAGEGFVAAAPRVVSRDVFERAEADEPTPLTITAEREIFGHAFLWETCHTGFNDRCVTAPPSPSEYAYFHLGAIETEEGEEVAVGQITLDTGHADLRAGRNATRRHYDDTGVAAADVRIVDGQFGGWVSGAVRDISDEDLRKLRAAKLSGDWRRVNGSLDLIGLLAVNVPGFPIPRAEARLVASTAGEQMCALVAAGLFTTDEEVALLVTELLDEPDEMEVLLDQVAPRV
jgi:2'-5' RNA ligase